MLGTHWRVLDLNANTVETKAAPTVSLYAVRVQRHAYSGSIGAPTAVAFIDPPSRFIQHNPHVKQPEESVFAEPP